MLIRIFQIEQCGNLLPPYETGVKAGAATIMSGFNDINGTPAVCNDFYMNEVLGVNGDRRISCIRLGCN